MGGWGEGRWGLGGTERSGGGFMLGEGEVHFLRLCGVSREGESGVQKKDNRRRVDVDWRVRGLVC